MNKKIKIMMPKAKAQELYAYYLHFVVDDVDYQINAKRCAKRVVAEILDLYTKDNAKKQYYWEEVDKEIDLINYK